jgi:hypothetical protein
VRDVLFLVPPLALVVVVSVLLVLVLVHGVLDLLVDHVFLVLAGDIEEQALPVHDHLVVIDVFLELRPHLLLVQSLVFECLGVIRL